ncbi:hypothetical protein C1H46_024712 [Malus baccata]|uniref:Rho-GAP domain-containing protein n=1 Tax=Malus baccata TaxID=106549 RepID=A0A540LTI8_MALBA|nr:hypothetical protein C1H46_024712 [Malus baccata]
MVYWLPKPVVTFIFERREESLPIFKRRLLGRLLLESSRFRLKLLLQHLLMWQRRVYHQAMLRQKQRMLLSFLWLW